MIGAAGAAGGGGVQPLASWAAPRALTRGSAVPSGSSGQVPWPTQPEVPSESATVPLGHSPLWRSMARTSAVVRPGLAAFIRAATPLTCGVAMLVPLIVL